MGRVIAALGGWFDPVPDIVLSGVNRGPNVGRAVLHSGTVCAALTTGLHDRRGLAVALDVPLHPTGDPHWETPAAFLPGVLRLLLNSDRDTVLSLNRTPRSAGHATLTALQGLAEDPDLTLPDDLLTSRIRAAG